MNHLAPQLDDAFQGRREIGDAEVGKRDAIAGPLPARMDAELHVSAVRLDTRSLVLPPSSELHAQHSLPEEPRPLEVVRRELDKIDHQLKPRGTSTHRASACGYRLAVFDLVGDLWAETGLLLSPTLLERGVYERWRREERPLVMAIEREGMPL